MTPKEMIDRYKKQQVKENPALHERGGFTEQDVILLMVMYKNQELEIKEVTNNNKSEMGIQVLTPHRFWKA